MNSQYTPVFDAYESSLWAAKSAKILCSALFISNREVKEAFQNSVLGHDVFINESEDIFTYLNIDKKNKEVQVRIKDSPIRTAKYIGDQGSIILPLDSRGIFFQPTKVETSLPSPNNLSWPMGDVIEEVPFPEEINKSEIQQAVDTVFADSNSLTTAFLILYKGNIIAEKYDLGVNQNTQLESWSMGKSITATLIGILIEEGHLKIDSYAPVPKWKINNDPRSKIKIADLLRMSSGLKFSGMDDPPYTYKLGFPDHEYVYSGAIDVFQFSINQPLEFPPNTVGRYRNCDPLALGYIIKNIVTGKGEEYLTWPQKILFDRIGIREQMLETDPYGNFIMTGFDYGTARNWARLGLLYLQDGVWNRERILPEGFVDFVSSPAPAWKDPVYGGLFWVNGTSKLNLPQNAYYMSGVGVQRVIIVPSHDLVIVRMGHRRGKRYAEITLNQALEKIISSINI